MRASTLTAAAAALALAAALAAPAGAAPAQARNAAAAAPSQAPGLSQAEIQAMDPAIASCVLANLEAARTATAAGILVQACTRLVAAGAASPGGDDQLFVRCKVATDPEWIEFRLVTRRQCAAAAGLVQR